MNILNTLTVYLHSSELTTIKYLNDLNTLSDLPEMTTKGGGGERKEIRKRQEEDFYSLSR